MKRKIIMLCSVWNENYIGGLLRGIGRRIENENVELHVFASYDTAGDSTFQKKEQEIFSLPDLEAYDGILIACNSEGNRAVVEKLVERYKKYNKQILSIEQKFESIAFAGVNNYREFYNLVEHMITVHDCKVLNYLGGPAENAENRERFKAFCDCMEKHHLAVDEKRVLHYKFMHMDGKSAYEAWKEHGLHLPDAVICANDNMAIGYCDAAMADGYCIPQDFRVTGFDNSAEGQYFCPSITSVNRNWEQLGYDSIDHLLTTIEEKQKSGDFDSRGRMALNESCGCAMGQRNIRTDIAQVYHEKKQKEELELKQRVNRMVLCGCKSLDELQEKLGWCLATIEVRDMALCVNSSMFEEEMTAEKKGYDRMLRALTNQGRDNMQRDMTIWPMNPVLSTEEQIYIFSSLNFGKDTYGYIVAIYEDKLMRNDLYRTFKETVALALENVRQREELRRMNLKLQQLYVQDPLTGLYNRFGYMNQAENYLRMHNGEIYLIYVDVDNLKLINDEYGHAVGDLAIKGVASAIQSVFGSDSICVRMGGDEFLVMNDSNREEVIWERENAITLYLEEYSRKVNLPFVLHASMGHISSAGSTEGLEVLVKQADDKMYEVKQKRKKELKQ